MAITLAPGIVSNAFRKPMLSVPPVMIPLTVALLLMYILPHRITEYLSIIRLSTGILVYATTTWYAGNSLTCGNLLLMQLQQNNMQPVINKNLDWGNILCGS